MSEGKPPPSPLATPPAWDLVAPGYTEINLAQFERYASDAIRIAELTPSDRIVDIATGPGSLALLASPKVTRVDALDFSAVMIAELKRRIAQGSAPNVYPALGDGQALPYVDASFDAAFSMFGLIFYPDRRRGFAEMRRVLRPGGRAVVSSWQPMDRVPAIFGIIKALAAELPAVPFGDGKGPLTDPDDLRDEMSAAGFDVEINEVTHAVESPGLDDFWNGMLRSFAPLVLLENRLGAEAFTPIAQAIKTRLQDQLGPGPIRVSMPAWLALGRAH